MMKENRNFKLVLNKTGFLFFFLQSIAWADNCGSLQDCFSTVAAAASTIAALSVGIGLFSMLSTLTSDAALGLQDFFNQFSLAGARWGQAAKAAFGIAVNGLGIIAGAGAFLLPEAIVTKVIGTAIAAKSVAGLVMNGTNLVNAFRVNGPAEGPGSVGEWAADRWAPGNTKIKALATVAEMGMDLTYSLNIGSAVSAARGFYYPQSGLGPPLELVHLANPSELGRTADVFTGADIMSNAYSRLSDILTHKGEK